MNNEVIKYRKSVINRSFLLGAGIAICLTLFQQKEYAVGVIVGVVVSGVNFFLLSKQILGLQQGTRRNFFLGSFLVRYVLLGVCLYYIVKTPTINVFGFLGGYLILQLNLFIASFLSRPGEPSLGEESKTSTPAT